MVLRCFDFVLVGFVILNFYTNSSIYLKNDKIKVQLKSVKVFKTSLWQFRPSSHNTHERDASPTCVAKQCQPLFIFRFREAPTGMQNKKPYFCREVWWRSCFWSYSFRSPKNVPSSNGNFASYVRACVSKYVFSVLQKSIGTCVCVCVGVRACLQMQTHIQVQTSILLQEYLEVGNGSSCKWVQKFDFFFVLFAARSAAGFQFPDAGTCNSRNLWPNNAHGTESDSGNSRWSGSTLGFKHSKKKSCF